MLNTFVLSITHLKDRPNEDRALEMLKKITSLVKPIMRKHGWVLPELAEFFPENPNLLGECDECHLDLKLTRRLGLSALLDVENDGQSADGAV